ncbi:phage tail protein [Formicincola oecophyllae]|nr:phage tail protein [Formicincola oecophyllae]
MSSTFTYANRAKTILAQQVLVTDTSLTLQSGAGSLFPQPSNGEMFALTLVSVSSPDHYEICYVTSRNADTLSVIRGQEGTAAQPFAAGDSASLNMTAGLFKLFPQAGWQGLYSDDTAKRLGGYKKNALVADPNDPCVLWISQVEGNSAPPSPQNPNWLRLDFLAQQAQIGQMVSGVLGMGSGDTAGTGLHLNGGTGCARFWAQNGTNFDLASTQQVTQSASPVGSIMAYAGFNPPWPWLLCNGAGFDAGQFPALFNMLGSSSTPDLRGVFLRGVDSGRGYDSNSNRTVLSLQGGSVISEHRDVRSLWHGGQLDEPAAGCGATPSFQGRGGNADSDPEWGIARPVNVAVNYIIKAA